MSSKNRRALLLTVVAFFFTANSSYIGAFADPTIFYMTNVLIHLGLGFALFLAFLYTLVKRASKLSFGDAWWIVGFLAGIAGIALITIGNLTRYRWLLYTHIALSVISLILFALKEHEWLRVSRRVVIPFLLLSLLFPVSARLYAKYYGPSGLIKNPTEIPLTMEEEGGGVNSPFFPSSATTNTGTTIPANFFMTSHKCAECHKDIYDQWNSSAHHISSFNNQWYRKSIEYMQDVVGVQPSKWCAGCHDHAVFFNGRFDKPIKDQINTPEAQNGLGCTSCHSIVHVRSSMGQADFEIEYPPLHDLAVSDNPVLKFVHDLLLRADPEPHKKAFMKPFHRQNTAEFCSSCHKVHLDNPVNDYRWFRGFNDYDNWQASGISHQGGRSFYSPPKPMKCADCHMPLVASNDPAAVDGKVHSHRFPGANTALPYVNDDKEQLKIVTDFLQDKQISVDIFAMSSGEPTEAKPLASNGQKDEPKLSSTFAIGEESMQSSAPVVLTQPQEITAPLNKVNASVRRGDSVRVDVVVRTRKVGHFFPGGTVDGFDVWVELQATDNNGKTIFWSGKTEDDASGRKGPVERG
ncbi:MAG: hypothetical protein JNN15_19715, partial [Blastocatellia bacterium]|nr:hypothetical protein [Blastocatellia bacterium]